MNVACWVCRGEALEAQLGAQRLGLCAEHLAERLRALMRPLPAGPTVEEA